jgi:hypothetical protein
LATHLRASFKVLEMISAIHAINSKEKLDRRQNIHAARYGGTGGRRRTETEGEGG